MREKNFIGKLDMIIGALKAQAVAGLSTDLDMCPVTVLGLVELLSDLRNDLVEVLRDIRPLDADEQYKKLVEQATDSAGAAHRYLQRLGVRFSNQAH
jgi:hypothetical protein